MSSQRRIRLATRSSALARRQTEAVRHALQRAWPDLSFEVRVIVTHGDRTLDRPLPEFGGKGLFTLELEQALHRGDVDLAVHSLKDLPVDASPELRLAAILPRADARDVLIAPGRSNLAALPLGAVVGTSSLRRQAQLLAFRHDLIPRPIRGNVETRLRKVRAGEYDAAILAAAGLLRLGLEADIATWLPFDVMLPAPGQGALAVQCRAEDRGILALAAALDDPPTRAAVEAERSFLSALGGGCSAPVGAYAVAREGRLHMRGVVASTDGREVIRVQASGDDARSLGERLAREALALGAARVVQHA